MAMLAILVLFSAAAIRAAEINVFAADSLTDALKEIASDFQRRSGDKVIFNFAASSLLARQIEEGAPADILFSADEAKMDGLEKKGFIVKETRKNLLSNSLVIIVAVDGGARVESVKDLASDKIQRLAREQPKAVPAGIYAREYLEKQNLWAAVERKVIPTENVRGALAAVETGNVDAGIVYKTDAAISRKVRVAYEIRRSEGPEIRYPVALVRESRNLDVGRKLLAFLSSPGAARVFEKYGFIVLK